MMMEQEINHQENQENKKFKIKAIIKGIVAFFIVTMSLQQVFFDRYSKEYSNHYDSYYDIIKERDFKQDSLLNELGNTLTVSEYKIARKEAWKTSQSKVKVYNVKERELAKEHSFLGRSSFKFWIFQFGIILLGFYFASKSFIEDVKKRLKTGHEIISLIGIAVCLYWFYHLFFKTASDFYNETYILFKVAICIAISFFVTRLMKYYAIKEGVIKNLLDLIFRIKSKYYKEIATKALYAERFGKPLDTLESVKDQTQKFDKDLKDTVNKIAEI